MTYVRIILQLQNGKEHRGIRQYKTVNLDEIKALAKQQAIKALGRYAILDIYVQELPATDPDVVRFILEDGKGK